MLLVAIVFDERRPMWEGPAENGAIGADTDDALFIGADADTGDRSAMADTDVGNHTLVIQPQLQNARKQEFTSTNYILQIIIA